MVGHDMVRQEEAEELGFVPSAVSEPQWALHLCDRRKLQVLPTCGCCVRRGRNSSDN